jgi:hypothetical protein
MVMRVSMLPPLSETADSFSRKPETGNGPKVTDFGFFDFFINYFPVPAYSVYDSRCERVPRSSACPA